MKKYNSFDHHMILLGIIIPILMFFLSMNATYAFFTASFKTEITNTSTAILKIQFSNDTGVFANSQKVTESSLVLPGDTISALGKVENVGDISVYTIISFKLQVTKFGETTSELLEEKYYTIINSELKEIIKIDDETYSQTAFIINVGSSQNFEINYQLDVNKFDNSYKKATITYNLQAFALQTETISDTNLATKMLFKQFIES